MEREGEGGKSRHKRKRDGRAGDGRKEERGRLFRSHSSWDTTPQVANLHQWVKFGMEESTQNFTTFGVMCHPCRAKKTKF